MANRYTILCKLVAKKEGQYTQYVFQNLEEHENSWDHYIMVTKCPNWQFNSEIPNGEKGYLTFEPVEAGKEYYNLNEEAWNVYKYSGNYFINFIKEIQEDINEKEFKF